MKRMAGVIAVCALLLLLLPGNPPGKLGRRGVPPAEIPSNRARPNDWFYRQRAFPLADIPYTVYQEAVGEARELRKKAMFKKDSRWQLVGPVNIGGRLTDVELTSDGVIYVGAASGGVFKSVDRGASWTAMLEDLANPSIGDIAIASSNEAVIYVGTGEANGGGGSLAYGGSGVYKSSDAGATWFPAGLRETRIIGRILVHPTNPDIVHVGAMGSLFSQNDERGIFRSLDGGRSWQQTLFLSDKTGCIDLVANPRRPELMYASMWERQRTASDRLYGGPTSGLYRSSDGGATWAPMRSGLPENFGRIGRIGLAIAASDPRVLYAIYADFIGFFAGVFKSTDGGDSWFRVQDQGLAGIYSNFGWWFGNIRVHPEDPDRVYALGLNTYISENGGANWSPLVNSQAPIHVDQHGLAFQPGNPSFTALANDGGLYLAGSPETGFTHIKNLPITQFYTCEIDFLRPERLYGGTQDNGTLRTLTGEPGDWDQFLGGDGFYVVVDPTNSDSIYAESQFGNLFHFRYGLGFPANVPGSPLERVNWNAPVVLDPNDPNTVYFGAQGVYRTSEGVQEFEPVSLDLTNGPGESFGVGQRVSVYGTITTIAVAPSDSNVIYAGTDDGNVWITENRGESWQKISANLPERWVTRVAVHPAQARHAYVTLSGFRHDDYLPHVLETLDGGSNWRDISGNLPQAPANDIIVAGDPGNTLFLATDLGVFYSRSGGTFWQVLGKGLPFVPVLDIDLHEPENFLVAATYGRSMYRLDLDGVLTEGVVRGSSFAHRYYLTEIESQDEKETWVGVINPGIEPAGVELFAFDQYGESLGRSEAFGVVGGRQRMMLEIGELFPGQRQRVAWIQVGADRQVDVFAELRRPAVRSAYWAESRVDPKIFVPHVAKDVENFRTVVGSINTREYGIQQVVRKGLSGTRTDILELYAPYAKAETDVRAFFGADLSDTDFLVLEGVRPGAVAMEYFETLPGRDRMAALGLSGRSGSVLRFLHVAADTQQFWTGLVYINVGASSARVTERYHGSEGQLLLERNRAGLASEGKVTLLVDQNGSALIPAATSWVSLESDQPLIGYELFGSTANTDQSFFAGLNGVYDSGTVLEYPHFQISPTTWTGIVAVNLGQETADIKFTLYNGAGLTLESQTIHDVPPGVKISRLANDLFTGEESVAEGAWIRAEANASAWAGFLLWGDQNQGPRRHLAGLNAVVR